jgi:protein subunit release factor A
LNISISAQTNNSTPAEKKAKLDAWHTAFLTSEMQLTTEEAQKFWPIYNEYKAEMEKLEKPVKAIGKTIEQMSDAELRQMIYKELDNEQQRVNMNKKYVDRFLTILPAIKIVRLKKAEREFKKMVLEQWRDNH